MSFFLKYRFWFKCVGLVWSCLAVTFLLYTVMYYLGNHDFRFARYGVPLETGMFEGRFSQFLPSYFFAKSEILPIWNVWLGFAFLAASVIWLAYWYGFEENAVKVGCFGVLIALHPYLLAQLYYVHSIFSICCWEFCCVAGLILVYEAVQNSKIWSGLIGVCCLILSFGGYASSLELVLVLFLGKIWLDVLKGKKLDRAAICFYLKVGCLIGGAGIIYAGIIFLMKKSNVIFTGMYNVQVMSVSAILQRFAEKWWTPFAVLGERFLFSPSFIKTGILLLACAGGIVIIREKKRAAVLLFLLFALVWSAFLLAYVSPFDFFHTFRIHALSVPYLWGIIFAGVEFKGRVWVKNLSFLGAVICICGFLRTEFFVQKVWYLGNKQDERLVERVLSGFIHEIPEYKHFRLSTMGEMLGREKFAGMGETPGFLRDRYRELYTFSYFLNIFFSDGLFLYENANPIWGDALYLGETIFYGVNNFGVKAGEKLSAEAFARTYGTDREDMEEALLKLRPYPERNYYFIGQKDIFLMFEDGADNRRVLLKNIRQTGF